MKKEKIDELREKIDELDEKIVSLLEERVNVVRKVGNIKAKQGVAMYDPIREQEILEKITKKSSLEPSFLIKFYREVISYCRKDERKIKRKTTSQRGKKTLESSTVAVLGPQRTFTEQAAKQVFGKTKFIYCENVEDVFKLVEDETVEYGVVAIENSLEGSVGKTMEALMEYDAHIVGELTLNINLCLMTKRKPKKIDVILSHPHALAQSMEYLKSNYPEARQISAKSTAAALKELARYENAAAIGLAEAARTYSLRIVAENIQDDFSQTRFIVISKKKSFGGKTSLIFAVKDEPGALYKILETFAKKDINLTKIESHPSKRKLGEYLFFMDFENRGLSEKQVAAVIESVKPKTTFLKVLGSY